MAGTSRSFWTAAQAWYGTHVGAQRKAKRLGVPGPKTGKLDWEADPERVKRSAAGNALLAQKLTGSAQVKVDPRLAEDMYQLAAKVVPVLRDAYDEHMGGFALKVFQSWPVASGLSKALISLEYTAQSNGIRFIGRLVSRAPYTQFIKNTPHRTLIQDPAQGVRDAIGQQVLTELQKGPGNG
jgi:hypothetical protein